jgi:hypothetical protein
MEERRTLMPQEEQCENLLAGLKGQLPELEELHARLQTVWQYEDPIYRFYHQSFKTYHLQDTTEEIVAALKAIYPELPLNDLFTTIVQEGTGKTFTLEHNQRWLEETRPIVEAFFHARFFLGMAVKYGRELKTPPHSLPSGWAAFLYLYNLR